MISRRKFLTGSAMAGLFGSTWAFSDNTKPAGSTPWYNWSGELSCIPAGRVAPKNEAALIDYIQSTSGALRPVGSGHSFSPLIPTDGHIIVIDQLRGLLGYDEKNGEATFGAGTMLADLGEPLNQVGRAMINMPDIDRQTFAGAISTATHGTGISLGGLSDYVRALRLITPTGETLDLDADSGSDLFEAARVSLGALGVISQITTKTRPAYRLKAVTTVKTLEDALDTFDADAASNRHHELFPFLYSDYTMCLSINETNEPDLMPPVDPGADQQFRDIVDLWMSTPAMLRKPLVDSVVGMLEPETKVGPSYKVLSNLRHNRFNEMEYAVPLRNGTACLREILTAVMEQEIDVVYPLEYRYVQGDETWLGMHSGHEDFAAISIHQQAGYDYKTYFDIAEPIFWKYGGRPHWGKVHSLGREQLTKLYPRFEDFRKIRAELDPDGRMLNAHLKKLFL